MSPAFSSSDGGIFRSDDVGKTWKRFDHGVKAEATMMGVAVHPRNPQQVVGVSKTGQVFRRGQLERAEIARGRRRLLCGRLRLTLLLGNLRASKVCACFATLWPGLVTGGSA